MELDTPALVNQQKIVPEIRAWLEFQRETENN